MNTWISRGPGRHLPHVRIGPSRFAPHAPLKSDRKNAAARINASYHLLFRTGTVGFCACLD